MSKFCSKCGVELPDDATFCNACGENLGEPAPAASPVANFADAAMEKGTEIVERVKGDKKLLGIIAGALVALILIIAFWGVIFPGPKSAVDNYIDAMFNGKYKAYTKIEPKAITEYKEEEYDYEVMEKDDFEDSYEEYLEGLEEEYGKNFKATYKVTDKDKLSDNKLDDIRDDYKDRYDIAKKDIKAAYELEVEIKLKGKDDNEVVDGEFIVYKLGGKWYVYDFDIDYSTEE